jgi:hypothetical protein
VRGEHSRVWQVSGGTWYSLYKGNYGMLRIGAQGSYTRRNIFKGIGGSPSTDEGMFFTSLRYYPHLELGIDCRNSFTTIYWTGIGVSSGQ